MAHTQVSEREMSTFSPKNNYKEAKSEQSNKTCLSPFKSALKLPLFPQSLETSHAEHISILFLMPLPIDHKGKKNPVSKNLKAFLSTLGFGIAFRRDI